MVGSTGELLCSGCSFVGNTATSDGGGGMRVYNSEATIMHSVRARRVAESSDTAHASTTALLAQVFHDNSAASDGPGGGGMEAGYGVVSVHQVRGTALVDSRLDTYPTSLSLSLGHPQTLFRSNAAPRGGGLMMTGDGHGTSISCFGCTFEGNTATIAGGGFYAVDAPMLIQVHRTAFVSRVVSLCLSLLTSHPVSVAAAAAGWQLYDEHVAEHRCRCLHSLLAGCTARAAACRHYL